MTIETARENIELQGVTIQYGPIGDNVPPIVEDYHLKLLPGTMHCLAGRSGSGKTSILRVAAGLVTPSAGSVFWGGQDLGGLKDDAITEMRRSHVGYLDQGGVLVSGLTALENVLLPAVPDKRTRELGTRARGLLEELGVGKRASHYPDKLSGGERQRVAFARALLLEPAVIMADEPTASLDRANADAVIDILQNLTDRGISVLVAAHDPSLIAAATSVTALA